MENKDSKVKKSIKLFTLAILILIAIVCIFFGTYFFFINRSYTAYEKSLKIYLSNITDINKSVDNLNKNQTIDVSKVKAQLPQKIDNLTKIQSSIDRLTPSNKYKNMQLEINSGLKNNILIYKQIMLIIDNPEASDLDSSLKNIEDYKENCINSYSKVKIKNSDISLPNETLIFIENTNFYVNELIKLKKNKEIQKSQNISFIDNINEITDKFQSSKIDFTTVFKSIKNYDENENYDDLLESIKKNKETLNDIRKDFVKLTVPQNSVATYNSLSTAFDDYELYIESLKYAITVEKSQNDSSSLLYDNAKDKYNKFSKDYDNFSKNFSDLKDSK